MSVLPENVLLFFSEAHNDLVGETGKPADALAVLSSDATELLDSSPEFQQWFKANTSPSPTTWIEVIGKIKLSFPPIKKFRSVPTLPEIRTFFMNRICNEVEEDCLTDTPGVAVNTMYRKFKIDFLNDISDPKVRGELLSLPGLSPDMIEKVCATTLITQMNDFIVGYYIRILAQQQGISSDINLRPNN